MEFEIKVEVIARETIKPSSSTPNHLRCFKLSLLDQYATPLYMGSNMLYSGTLHSGAGTDASGSKRDDDHEEEARARSQRLKESLSETLTRFYPLAGRLRDNLSVDCNDMGAHYLEARVINCSLSDLLERPKIEELNHLLPIKHSEELGEDPPFLLVQASFFPCGGMAVGVNMSHKIADGAAFSTFIKAWSSTALGCPDAVVPDLSAASSRFPPTEDFPVPQLSFKHMTHEKPLVTRRFVFDAPKIAALKTKSASASVNQPTRVEAVTALVWKCAIAASRSRLGGSPRPYALKGGLNLRARLVPPLPKYSFANLVGLLWAMVDDEEDDYEGEIRDLPGLVCRLRKGVEESTINNSTDKVAKLKQLKADKMETHLYSSWCKFSFYEAEFGWGKPTWAVGGNFLVSFPNVMVLMDTRDGEGVEVWIRLLEEDMALFESDQDLLAYASPNPSAL